MFHRVKSESPEQVKQSQNPVKKASEDTPEKPEENASEQPEDTETTEAETLRENANTNETKAEKENSSMNAQAATVEDDAQTDAQNEAPVAGYAQRASQIPGSYAGYQSSNYVAPTAPSAPAAAEASEEKTETTYKSINAAGNTLTIGEGITMSGEIGACDHLVVEGTVEAALKGARVLDVAESGTFFGSVEIEEATVAGRFEGEITVNGRLKVRSGGVITGTIAYKELEVESGAVIDGRIGPVREQIQRGQSDKSAQAGRQASQMAKAKSSTAAKDAANADGELFVAAK